MKIFINGEESILAADQPTITDALHQFLTALQRKQSFAVALNSSFVAKEMYATTLLRDEDSLEIFLPIQGG